MQVNRRVSIVAGLLATACGPFHRGATLGAPADSSGVNYALRQMYSDSLERVRMNQFFAEYTPKARPLEERGNFLGNMLLLQDLKKKFPGSPAIASLATQQIGTLASFLGDYGRALELFDEADDDPPKRSPDTLNLDRYSPVDAVDAIVAAADTARAIFINEAHHVPQTRVLTLALLAKLRAKGFTYLAAETLNPLDSALNTRDYPLRKSGYYSNEPLFGQVLRAARQLGYTLVPYEPMGASSQDERESGQAKNIRDRIFAADPNARVLVHAGYSHINEGGSLAGATPMAVRFRELTGINPVTVDQTDMREHAERSKEAPHYRETVDRVGGDRSFVLRRENGSLWSRRPGIVDVTVFNPPSRLRDGRPSWLWNAGTRTSYPLGANICRGRDPCAVTASRAGELDDAVPTDMLLVRAGKSPGSLALPPGSYRIVARDAGGTIVSDTAVTVRATK